MVFLKKCAFMSLFAVVCWSIGAQEAAKGAQPPAGAVSEQPASTGPDMSLVMAYMRPDTVVLQVGDMQLKWREIQRQVLGFMPKDMSSQSAKDTFSKSLRMYLQGIAKRGVFLHEARGMKLSVDAADRKQFEDEMQAGLLANNNPMTKEQFIASFGKGVSTLSKLTYEDALLIMKFDKVKFAALDITADEIAFYKRYQATVNKGLQQENTRRRMMLDHVLVKSAITTPEAFKALAKEISEGVEADNGGVLDYRFTRQELAEVNGLKSFDFKVGEMTPILETETALRVMMILKEYPAAKAGEEPKYQVAQMLFAKLPAKNLTDDEIRKRFLPEKRRQEIDRLAQQLSVKYGVKTLFFPEGLWEDKRASKKKQ